ncbi:lipopolysaccharide assembly protein LapA domain-containing protein [Sulfobacillus thermosulfidooxidans]|uniref:lipopolysaccharide assembly protein LapA domain-containing protein n=1 Tax=Sulfobacillus thermosulfidooxidans TaxID=28034 RepID=UPI0013011FA5|nr:lipopolysaccharide assembly protein LapA domain-containing protein [Sulfobacillus thermosulfidooxidans]
MVNPESRGLRKVIVWLFGAVIIAILALQNQHPVSLHVFFWQLPHISLALVVLLSLLLGASIGAGGMLWDRYKSKNRSKHLAPMLGDESSSVLPPSSIEGMPDDSPTAPTDSTPQ